MTKEIDILLARCDEVIARLKDDLRVEERVRDRLVEIKAQLSATSVVSTNPTILSGTQTVVVTNGGHRPAGTIVAGSLISHVTQVLREAKREMKAREIAERVQARGYQSNARGGLTIAVASVLAHKQGTLFRKVSKGKYTLRENPVATQ